MTRNTFFRFSFGIVFWLGINFNLKTKSFFYLLRIFKVDRQANSSSWLTRCCGIANGSFRMKAIRRSKAASDCVVRLHSVLQGVGLFSLPATAYQDSYFTQELMFSKVLQDILIQGTCSVQYSYTWKVHVGSNWISCPFPILHSPVPRTLLIKSRRFNNFVSLASDNVCFQYLVYVVFF